MGRALNVFVCSRPRTLHINFRRSNTRLACNRRRPCAGPSCSTVFLLTAFPSNPAAIPMPLHSFVAVWLAPGPRTAHTCHSCAARRKFARFPHGQGLYCRPTMHLFVLPVLSAGLAIIRPGVPWSTLLPIMTRRLIGLDSLRQRGCFAAVAADRILRTARRRLRCALLSTRPPFCVA